jgi:REP element-mobilizing transposase RayT
MRKLLSPYIYSQVKVRHRGRLPHWYVDNGLYSITYRLGDSLPGVALDRLRDLEKTVRPSNAVEAFDVRRTLEHYFDEELHASHGSCALRDPRIAERVIENWRHFPGMYELMASCVMPNHVHVVMRLFRGEDLDDVLWSWKSYTSKVANRILGQQGRFWQREYFDRLIRSEADLEDTIEYVVRNPEKAGLQGWPYVWRAGRPPAHQPAGGRRSEGSGL